MPSVHADYRLAARLIAEHLRQRAVKHVGILWARGVPAHPTKPVLRSVFEEDFIPTLKELLGGTGIVFDPASDVRSVTVSTDVAAIRREVCHWLKVAQRPAALCVADDFVAGVVLQVAAEKKLEVPDDLSVISLNDLGIAEKLLPPVTALHIAPDELGRRAAQLLLARLEGDSSVKETEVAIPPTLQVRAS